MGMKRVKVRVPATTANLGPGFDVLALALRLYNTVEMEVGSGKSEKKLQIDIVGEGEDNLPRDRRNIVYRAAKLVFDRFHFAPRTLHIKLVNRIPLASGLGSSAAARIGGLASANRLCGGRLSREELLNLAAEIEGHADNVSAAMVGGLTVSCISSPKGRKGKKIEIVKLDPPGNLSCVVCIPNFQIMTSRARKILPRTVKFEQAVFTSSRVAMLLAALIRKRYELLGMAMEDRLHQPYRRRLVKGMEVVFEEALRAGALGVSLSGAGPSILAFTASSPPSCAEKVGKAMRKAFAKHKVESRYLVLGIDKQGTKIV
ncbi:MAG TPA: homoserine kinase [bacterium]|nr:homoserine kinase [bacterium]